MTPSQIDALQIIINNETIMSALRAVFLEEVEESRPSVQDQTNEVIGQKYRAYHTGKEMIDDAFIRLASYNKGNTLDSSTPRHI